MDRAGRGAGGGGGGGGGSFPDGKERPRAEIDHSPPHSAEVMYKRCYTSSSSICLLGMQRNNFCFVFLWFPAAFSVFDSSISSVPCHQTSSFCSVP